MAKSTVPIELPGEPTADLHATTKLYVDEGLADKPDMPFIGPVPAGSTTPTITHSLGTNDVDVTVYRVTDGVQVGVPADRVDMDNVQLTFTTAPTSGQYRVVVSAGTGAGGPGGGGGGTPDPHAASHGSGGSDPVTPAAIGAATAGHTHEGTGDHDHAGVYAATVHGHNGLAPSGGGTGQVLTKVTSANHDYDWADAAVGGGGGDNALKPFPPRNLTPYNYFDAGRNFTYRLVDTNAALGNHFRIDWATPTQDVFIRFTFPTGAADGQIIMYELRAPGAVDGRFFFPSQADTFVDHPTMHWIWGDVGNYQTLTAAGTVDYLTTIYDARARNAAGGWRVISLSKGYPA
jgi:hypothetical protein